MKKTREKEVIDLLSQSYVKQKRYIYESERGFINGSYKDLEAAVYIKEHMELVIRELQGNERLIIEKEVLEGLRGKWYENYFSQATYYRTRQKAYEHFIRCLDS